MQSVLRQPPYSLAYNDLVVAKVRSRNSIDWSEEYSDENTVGARIQVLPSRMADPYEGLSTDDTRIQVNWVALVGDDTGGTAILSYNLEMLVGDVEVELVGMTSYYKDTSYLKQTGIVSG